MELDKPTLLYVDHEMHLQILGIWKHFVTIILRCLKDHHVYDPQMVGLYHNLHHIACPFFLTLQMSGGFMKNLVLFHMFLLFVALSHFDEVFVNPIEIQFLIFVWWQRHDFFL